MQHFPNVGQQNGDVFQVLPHYSRTNIEGNIISTKFSADTARSCKPALQITHLLLASSDAPLWFLSPPVFM